MDSPDGNVIGRDAENCILQLEDPSNKRSGIGGTERSGMRDFCAKSISRKQWDEPLSRSVCIDEENFGDVSGTKSASEE